MSTEFQLEQIADVERIVVVRGHEIKIREVRMKELREFANACSPFLKAFDEAGELAVREDGQAPDDFALFRVLSDHSEAFMKAAALVSNAPVEFFEKLRPDEFFNVAAVVVEVNGSFFVRALAPALLKFARGVSLIGLTLSNGLSPLGTMSDMLLSTPTASSTVS